MPGEKEKRNKTYLFVSSFRFTTRVEVNCWSPCATNLQQIGSPWSSWRRATCQRWISPAYQVCLSPCQERTNVRRTVRSTVLLYRQRHQLCAVCSSPWKHVWGIQTEGSWILWVGFPSWSVVRFSLVASVRALLNASWRLTFIFRSLRENLPLVQRTTHCEKENTREEKNPESGLQRIIPLRRPLQRRSHQHLPGIFAFGLGSSHEKWGHWKAWDRSQNHRGWDPPLEWGYELPTEADCGMAQAEGVTDFSCLKTMQIVWLTKSCFLRL